MSHLRKIIPGPLRRKTKKLLARLEPRAMVPAEAVRTIGICLPQVPFVHGGAEIHALALRDQLRQRGFQADLITVPYKWYPREQIENSIHLWQQLDLSEADGRPIDLLITTKFPSYFAPHPNKVLWLIHQFRQVYDLYGTPYSDFDPSDRWDEKIRRQINKLDREAIQGHRRLFSNSRNTAERLRRFNGLSATALYHPPKLHPRYRHERYGDFILSVGRLDKMKRIDWLIRSLRFCPANMRCLIAGAGPELNKLEALARESGVADRVEFLGYVDDQRLLQLYAECFAVYYAPFDEDYGYVTLEAFFSQKPVLSAVDSGGTLEFVVDGQNGFIIEPNNEQRLAEGITLLFNDRERCRAFGLDGLDRVKGISWDHAIRELLGLQP
ncbi:MAG: glycosyltransferase family 4 protein [Candidatus Aminicenantes bacterium]|nr:glycosyltransferase family 4 protein [Candidatus Aminicenantes bacterium]